jgi:hypothetical protein
MIETNYYTFDVVTVNEESCQFRHVIPVQPARVLASLTSLPPPLPVPPLESTSTPTRVGIFWDIENCAIPSSMLHLL